MKMEKKGFTLMEIMIVVSIIGLLASLGTMAVLKAVNNSRIKTAQSELEMIAAATLQLVWDTGKWPNGTLRTSEVGENNEVWNLSGTALMHHPVDYPNWKGPYYDGSLVDPWGKSYFFDSDYLVAGSNRVVVGSCGPNRSGENRYDKDNIYVFLDD